MVVETVAISNTLDATQRVVLYSIGALGIKLKNRVDIQKILFLTAKTLPEIFEDTFSFQKHKKGPYSESIDESISEICNSGYVAGAQFDLSSSGKKVFYEIEQRIREPLKHTLLQYKEFVLKTSEDELLTFIYVVFPEYIENSEEWERLEKFRVKTAISMLKKEIITPSMAAEIAGMEYFEFEKILDSNKIRWKS